MELVGSDPSRVAIILGVLPAGSDLIITTLGTASSFSGFNAFPGDVTYKILYRDWGPMVGLAWQCVTTSLGMTVQVAEISFRPELINRRKEQWPERRVLAQERSLEHLRAYFRQRVAEGR